MTSKSVTKRFRVVLQKDEHSEATGIQIPFNVQQAFGSRARVPVTGTINGFPFRSSVFPMGDGHHYMVVNKEVRAGAGVRGGDTISIVMQRDDAPRIITPPLDLARVLRANKAAQAAWDKLSYTHRKEYVKAIEEARKPETRQRRIEKTVAQLTTNGKS